MTVYKSYWEINDFVPNSHNNGISYGLNYPFRYIHLDNTWLVFQEKEGLVVHVEPQCDNYCKTYCPHDYEASKICRNKNGNPSIMKL